MVGATAVNLSQFYVAECIIVLMTVRHHATRPMEVSQMNPLIVYYSYSGITRRLAEDIALITGGDLRELEPEKPYSFSYGTAVKAVRAQIESGHCPPLRRGLEDIDGVGTVFIGSPNWLKTFAPPVLSFLRAVDLSGKTIIPFCTHGGGGFGHMLEDYKRECTASDVREGLALTGTYSFDELQEWLEANGCCPAK